MEHFYAQIPGLKVIAPAIPGRREGPAEDRHPRRQPGALLRERDALQREGRGPGRPRVARSPWASPASRARAKTSRSSRGRAWCTSRSRPPQQLAKEGIEVEVIDLRSLRPLDDRRPSLRSVAQDAPRGRGRRGLALRRRRRRDRPIASSGSPSTNSTRRSSACTTLDVPMPYNADARAATSSPSARASSRRSSARSTCTAEASAHGQGSGDAEAVPHDGGGAAHRLAQERGRRGQRSTTSSPRSRPTRRRWSSAPSTRGRC